MMHAYIELAVKLNLFIRKGFNVKFQGIKKFELYSTKFSSVVGGIFFLAWTEFLLSAMLMVLSILTMQRFTDLPLQIIYYISFAVPEL